MTAAMLVLEPILKPTSARTVRVPSWAQCPTGGGRGGALLYRGHPEVVDADLADYFGSIPHAELLSR